MKNEIQYIRIDMIQPNLRLSFPSETIDDLSWLIQSEGQYEPLKVFLEGGRFRILDGEKRWRAGKKIGMAHLKAFIAETHYPETQITLPLQIR